MSDYDEDDTLEIDSYPFDPEDDEDNECLIDGDDIEMSDQILGDGLSHFLPTDSGST